MSIDEVLEVMASEQSHRVSDTRVADVATIRHRRSDER